MNHRTANLTAGGVGTALGLPYSNGKTGAEVLLAFYKENKYPLLAFEAGRNGYDFFKSAEYIAAREQHSKTFNSMREEYLQVRNRWLEAGITCMTIKSGEPFPAFPYTSDNLDILIREKDETAARAILEQLGYVELKNLEEPQKFLFRKFRGGALALDIHLHTRAGWGVGFIDGEQLLSRARVSQDDEKVIIPSPEDVVLITLAHAFYENKRIRLADLLKVQAGFRGAIDWKYLKNTASSTGWLDGMCFCIALCAHLEKVVLHSASIPPFILRECLMEIKRSFFIKRYYYRLIRRRPVSLPFNVSFVFGKFVFYKKVLRDRHDSPATRLYNIIRTLVWGVKLKLHIRPQSPFLISFSGVDGSGKSIHAQLLQKCLAHYDLRTSYRWSRCATGGITRFFSICGQALLRRLAGKTKTRDSSVARRQETFSNPVLRFIWSYLTATDMIVYYFFKVTLPLLFGQIVICDRYVYDAAAEMESSLPKVDSWNRFAIRMMLALTRKPDIAYIMDVPESISTQRREENTDTDYLRRQRNIYMEMSRRHNLHVIHTDRDFSDNTDEILTSAARRYFENFPGTMNRLFFSHPAQLNKKTVQKRLKVLVVTNMYPSPEKPAFGTFVKEQVESLKREGIDADVFLVDGTEHKMNYVWGLFRFWAQLLNNDYDIIHAHYVFSGMIARAQSVCPVVVTHHGLEVFTGWQRFPSRLLTPLVDRAILVSEEQKRRLGFRNVEVIPCGVDMDFFKPMDKVAARNQLNLPLNKKLVLWAGNHLRSEKRFDIVQAGVALAQKKDPSIELLLVSGQPHTVVPVYMNAADVLLLVSDAEGSPMAIKEALACNLPVVSTPVGDVPEVIAGLEGCYLCSQDPADVAEKLLLALSGSGCINGRDKIRPMEEGSTARRIINLYKDILKK